MFRACSNCVNFTFKSFFVLFYHNTNHLLISWDAFLQGIGKPSLVNFHKKVVAACLQGSAIFTWNGKSQCRNSENLTNVLIWSVKSNQYWQTVESKNLVGFRVINYSLEIPNLHDTYLYFTTALYDNSIWIPGTVKLSVVHMYSTRCVSHTHTQSKAKQNL